MWEFNCVKDVLTNELAKRLRNGTPLVEDCIEEILLLHRLNLSSLYLQAYTRLAWREAPISDEEGEKLGLSFSLKMSAVREKHYSKIAKKNGGDNKVLRRDLRAACSDVASLRSMDYRSIQYATEDAVRKFKGLIAKHNDPPKVDEHEMFLEEIKAAFNLPKCDSNILLYSAPKTCSKLELTPTLKLVSKLLFGLEFGLILWYG